MLNKNINEYTDQELVELSKKNPDDFAYLLLRYENKLKHYLYKISNLREEEIEDLLQEIFIKIYKNLNDYDENLKFSSWIYRISHNHFIDYIRKKKKQLNFSIDDDDKYLELKSKLDLNKNIENQDCKEIIKEHINKLDRKYKEVFILRFIEEKSYDEIIDILEKPKGTIASLIKRGKKLLYKSLEKQHKNCL